MPNAMPPLNALRAFEAAARLSSFAKAAAELHVTPGALSHQIRGLEDFFGLTLFERQARGVALTPQGKMLYPGLQAGFALIRDAVAGLSPSMGDNVLVVSTPPGITAKWLAPRLYRFAEAHPEIELRIASSVVYANFTTDGVDVAIRNVIAPPLSDSALVYEKLLDSDMVPVCSPKLLERFGPSDLTKIPLIHDDQLQGQPAVPTWAGWFQAAHIDGGDAGRGLRFSSSDHALDAASEGAGMLLTHAILAHDELRNGRLIIPLDVTIPSGRSYYFVFPKAKQSKQNVNAFREWLQSEIKVLDLPHSLGTKHEAYASAHG